MEEERVTGQKSVEYVCAMTVENGENTVPISRGQLVVVLLLVDVLVMLSSVSAVRCVGRLA